MPPKVKITKEEITAAALELLRQRGMEAITPAQWQKNWAARPSLFSVITAP